MDFKFTDGKLYEHIEKFAAAFARETGLDARNVVMMSNRMGTVTETWFRAKTPREIELDVRSETTAEMLQSCPVCPCQNCISRRKTNFKDYVGR